MEHSRISSHPMTIFFPPSDWDEGSTIESSQTIKITIGVQGKRKIIDDGENTEKSSSMSTGKKIPNLMNNIRRSYTKDTTIEDVNDELFLMTAEEEFNFLRKQG